MCWCVICLRALLLRCFDCVSVCVCLFVCVNVCVFVRVCGCLYMGVRMLSCHVVMLCGDVVLCVVALWCWMRFCVFCV